MDGKEIFKNDTEMLTKYLPDEDVELLKKGIKANSEAQLNQLLSDYDSIFLKGTNCIILIT